MESNFYLDGSLNTDTKPGDGLIVAGGANPDRETYVVTLKPGAGTWHQLGLDVVQDESLPGARYARGADRFLLSEVEAELVENDQPARRVPFSMATVNDTPPAVSTINDPGMPPLAAIDGESRDRVGHSVRRGAESVPRVAIRRRGAHHRTHDDRRDAAARVGAAARGHRTLPAGARRRRVRVAADGRRRQAAPQPGSQRPDDLGERSSRGRDESAAPAARGP